MNSKISPHRVIPKTCTPNSNSPLGQRSQRVHMRNSTQIDQRAWDLYFLEPSFPTPKGIFRSHFEYKTTSL